MAAGGRALLCWLQGIAAIRVDRGLWPSYVVPVAYATHSPGHFTDTYPQFGMTQGGTIFRRVTIIVKGETS